MKALTAILLYVGIIISFIQNWLLASVIMIGVFSYHFNAASLIPVAIILDGYFGNFYTVPYLSLIAVSWYIAIGYIQPKLINFKV
jgi:hypothetical protein